MITVFDRPCQNCRFTENRLVSEDRSAEIVEICLDELTEFACHADSRHMCHEFYNRHGDALPIVRVSRRTGKVVMIERERDERLPCFRETGIESHEFEMDV
jgi:hypothetical protein